MAKGSKKKNNQKLPFMRNLASKANVFEIEANGVKRSLKHRDFLDNTIYLLENKLRRLPKKPNHISRAQEDLQSQIEVYTQIRENLAKGNKKLSESIKIIKDRQRAQTPSERQKAKYRENLAAINKKLGLIEGDKRYVWSKDIQFVELHAKLSAEKKKIEEALKM